jgi:hypothetical protein
MDNANSNDTMADKLWIKLPPSIWKPQTHQLRCFGHILNLSVRAFWFGEKSSQNKEPELYEMIVVNDDDLDEQDSDEAMWRKMGPWGKIHNICSYIRGSPQRRSKFESIGAPKMVVADNAT